MQYSVKGITFSEDELSTVKLEDLRPDSVCPAHLFVFIKSKPFLLLRAGDYLDRDFLDKYRGRGARSFLALEVASSADARTWRSFFSRLNRCRSEKEKRALQDEFVRKFADVHWRKSSRSFLSFALACHDEFYGLPKSFGRELQEASHILFSRAVSCSAIAAAYCFVDGLLERSFMRDMYNAAFALDCGLAAGGAPSYLLLEACEAERKVPGSGTALLEKKGRGEKELFINHPEAGAKKAEAFESCFSNPEVIEHIRFHHEKTDGSGFPFGLTRSALASSETVLMFADHMTSFEERIFKEGDACEVVAESFKGLKALQGFETLMIDEAVLAWESAMKWANREIFESSSEEGEAA